MSKSKTITSIIFAPILMLSLLSCGESANSVEERTTKLLYQGHASLRLISTDEMVMDGTVIYVDPAMGDGYELPADIILITHEHRDHNQINLVTQKEDCVIIRAADAITNGEYSTFSIKGVEIEAVEAYNSRHSKLTSVGFLILIDGIMVYVAGDTSKTERMEKFSEKQIDYAFLPCDGEFNMNVVEAAECAEIIAARNNIPYHTRSRSIFDIEIAENFKASNRLIIEPGEEIILSKS